MHFTLTYDNLVNQTQKSSVEKQIAEVINRYSWVKPLSSTYIVNVPSQIHWDEVLRSISAISNRYPNQINFIMSPLMSGGKYNGFLNQNLWNEINSRSN